MYGTMVQVCYMLRILTVEAKLRITFEIAWRHNVSAVVSDAKSQKPKIINSNIKKCNSSMPSRSTLTDANMQSTTAFAASATSVTEAPPRDNRQSESIAHSTGINFTVAGRHVPNIPSLTSSDTNFISEFLSFQNEDAARKTVQQYLKVTDNQMNAWKTENTTTAGARSFQDSMDKIRETMFLVKSWHPSIPANKRSDGRLKSGGKYLQEAKSFSKWAKTMASDDIKQWSKNNVIPCTGPTKDTCFPFVTPEIAEQYLKHTVASKSNPTDAGSEKGDSAYRHVVNMLRSLMLKHQQVLIEYFVGSHNVHLSKMSAPRFNGEFAIEHQLQWAR